MNASNPRNWNNPWSDDQEFSPETSEKQKLWGTWQNDMKGSVYFFNLDVLNEDA